MFRTISKNLVFGVGEYDIPRSELELERAEKEKLLIVLDSPAQSFFSVVFQNLEH